jgi:hypothetical protein
VSRPSGYKYFRTTCAFSSSDGRGPRLCCRLLETIASQNGCQKHFDSRWSVVSGSICPLGTDTLDEPRRKGRFPATCTTKLSA